MKPSFTIPVAVIVGGLIVAAAVYVTVKPSPITSMGDGSTYRGELVRAVDTEDHILGNPAAAVKIIEYSDYDCQYCKQFDATLHQVVAAEGTDGDVAWVFRHFPLSEIHPTALSHARAAKCIAQTAGNDAFWEFSAALFARQPVRPDQYGAIASSIGVTGDAFSTCYANARDTVDERIQADRQNALQMGARGTPFTVIVAEGKEPIVLDGAYSYDAVRAMVDELTAPATEAAN